MEPDAVHEGVHEKSNSRQIPDILQDSHANQEREQVGKNNGDPTCNALDETFG
jgi:hypothetical protein